MMARLFKADVLALLAKQHKNCHLFLILNNFDQFSVILDADTLLVLLTSP